MDGKIETEDPNKKWSPNQIKFYQFKLADHNQDGRMDGLEIQKA